MNTVGSAIATKVPLEVQERLHSFAFSQLCSDEWRAADADKNGSLDVSELVPAMASVKEKMELGGPAPTLETAQAAMDDFGGCWVGRPVGRPCAY